MGTKLSERSILLDADVVRHFIKGDELSRLPQIFPGRFVMLDVVEAELCRSPHLYTVVTNFRSYFKIPVVTFPQEREIIKEYSILKKQMGEGESACLSVARFKKQFIASSNLTDIKEYCEKHCITYFTTMDLLLIGMQNGVFTEEDCDNFINKVILKKSKLPCSTISEYVKMKGV